MYPVSQWLHLKSCSINEVHSRWMLKTPLKGGSEARACRGTSIIDITANFGDIVGKTCPAVCERNTWTQCFHVTVVFFSLSIPYFSTAYKSSRLYQTCVSLTLYVWKESTVICTDKWCFQMCVRLVEHKFSELNLCLLWCTLWWTC